MNPALRKIDIHHHIFPPPNLYAYPQSQLNARVGWKTPEENLPWTPQKSIEAMDKMGVEVAVLSYPAGIPRAAPWGGTVDWLNDGEVATSNGREMRRMQAEETQGTARKLNEYARRVCEEGKGRFGWMACLPDLRFTAG